MKHLVLALLPLSLYQTVNAQQALYIPPALTGTSFNLNVQQGTKTFYGTTPTPTYGINGEWMSPTIIVNKGDSITLNVNNGLSVTTTMHWHGLHVSAMNDGGPHQSIEPEATWNPSFKVRNNAATFWYHPHGAGQTDPQVSRGLSGFFIVKDQEEAALNLPRTYGTDDIPLNIQSKAFDMAQRIAIATDLDTALFVNGTLNPYFDAPQQVIRFRLLNGSSLRSYNLGWSNGQTMYKIGTDGGLLDAPLAVTRLILSPGERAEILVDFSGKAGQTIYLKSFASELTKGIYGAAEVGGGMETIHDYADNPLNGADFNLMQVNVKTATSNPVTSIPTSLVPYKPFEVKDATNSRTIVMDTIRLLPADLPNRAEGPFGMNDKTFDMDVINEVVHLNTTEVWTLHNKTMVAHPFHIHDIQFNVIEKGGKAPAPEDKGWKDVVLVMPEDSIKFITRFETFADPMTPYMYHCHLLHHEDDGMMGTFTVIDTSVTVISDKEKLQQIHIFPNPTTATINLESAKRLEQAEIRIFDVVGRSLRQQNISGKYKAVIDISDLAPGLYLLQIKEKNQSSTLKIRKQ